MLTLVKTASLRTVGLPLLLILVAGACKEKEAPAAGPASPAPIAPASPTPITSAEPVAPVPTPPLPTSATEAERRLAEAFIDRFLAAIEKNEASEWPALHTKARRDALKANGAVDNSYEAWRKGTLTVIPRIRAADFALLKSGERFTLRFVGVKVPTDPDVEYSMTVAIEDGEMRISEK